jgi:hypothetical protein
MAPRVFAAGFSTSRASRAIVRARIPAPAARVGAAPIAGDPGRSAPPGDNSFGRGYFSTTKIRGYRCYEIRSFILRGAAAFIQSEAKDLAASPLRGWA